MSATYKPAGFDWAEVSADVTIDEFGNKIISTTYMLKGNQCDNLAGTLAQRPTMLSSKEVLSRSCSYDRDTCVTRFTEVRVASYGTIDNIRASFEAQSGLENIVSHPDFEKLAGTPEKPKLDKAVWVSDNNDDTDMRFVEFKEPQKKALTQYITGTGNVLRETYIGNANNFSNIEQKMGKITTPQSNLGQSLGYTTTWICAGAEIEPFGNQYRVSVSYKSSSAAIWGREAGSGWNTKIYGSNS